MCMLKNTEFNNSFGEYSELVAEAESFLDMLPAGVTICVDPDERDLMG